MKTYHFDIADRVRLEDPVGLDCESDHAACRTADAMARQIAEDIRAREDGAVIVVDDKGEELYRAAIKR